MSQPALAGRFLDVTEPGQGYVGNDSVGLNLSAFCGKPSLGLFGPTAPLTYSSFIRTVCAGPRWTPTAMDAISVEAVAAAVRRELDHG